MQITAALTTLEQIVGLREQYRQEMDCQIIHDSIHARPGWSLEYALSLEARLIGYGSVAKAGPWKAAPVIYEFFVEHPYRARLFDCFVALHEATGISRVETQSNDVWLTSMLLTFARDVKVESILFKDEITTHLLLPDVQFRNPTLGELPDVGPDQLASHGVLVLDETVVARGGILFHYNRPYGDIYMEVSEPFRRRGLGAFLVQELKRVCYERGNVPSARCNPANIGSRKTLQKAGFVPCGHIVSGVVVV
jgi:GNAT superfamily N-acetyltransferase